MSWFLSSRYMHRIPWQTPVMVYHDKTGKPIDERAEMRDISKHGLGVMTSERLTQNSIYRFEFRMGDYPWRMRGRVVYERRHNAFVYYGIRLEALSGAERREWARFLRPYSGKVQAMSIVYGLLAGGAAAWAASHYGCSSVIIWTIFFVVTAFFTLLLPFG